MHNDLITIGNFTLHGYSAMIALGFIISLSLCYLRAKKDNVNMDIVGDYAIICVLGGFLGAKILYLIVDYKALIADPKSVLGFPQIFSGFVVYGGIITATIIMLIYSKIKKVDFFEYIDYIIPHVAIVQGFGRIGCFLAGCCYGAETTSPLGVIFPEGSIAPAGVKLWPTQLFSAAGNFLIAGILFLAVYVIKVKKKGNIAVLYLLLYSVGRFLVEFLRNDARGSVGALSTSQFIAIFTFAAGIALGVYINIFKKDKQSDKNEKKADK